MSNPDDNRLSDDALTEAELAERERAEMGEHDERHESTD